MWQRLGLAMVGLLGALSAPQLLAAPVVLFDNGHTQPIPFPKVMNVTTVPPTIPASAPAHASATALSAVNRLPIRTRGMQVGTLAAATVAAIKPNLQYLSQAFFVIGSDDYSLRWLRHYHDTLIKVGAVGLLVQAETQADLQQVAQAGRGLTIAPVSGLTLVKALKLTHYPVLISHRGVEQ